MDSRRGPGMADFKPKVGGDEATRGRRFRMSRSVAIIIVVGAHVVAGALFAIPVIQRAIGDAVPEQLPGPPVTMVDMVIAEQNVAADKVSPGTQTRPPALKPGTDTPAEHARRAGIALPKPARALLLVRVTEAGKPGDVTVVESSGDVRLDEVAIQYARSLEWTPAMVAGRESSMSIRLPVEFQAGELADSDQPVVPTT
jgi:TonB family protein